MSAVQFCDFLSCIFFFFVLTALTLLGAESIPAAIWAGYTSVSPAYRRALRALRPLLPCIRVPQQYVDRVLAHLPAS